MTDAELIAMARLAQRDDRMSTGALYGDLADRIEELDRACSEWADASQANYQRAKKAEAKLAKAVEAERKLHEARIKAQAAEIERLRGDLKRAVQFTKRVIRHTDFWGDDYLAEQARTALAELTGAQKDGN